MRGARPGLIGALSMTLALGVLATSAATAAQPTAATTYDRTSASERARVDAVPTPTLNWYTCFDYAQCAVVDLPMDYDNPTGKKTQVAMLKIAAAQPSRRIGTLFLNPGGPGGSGTQIAYYAPLIFGQDILDRFDIVGFDPRGTNFSDNVRCFTDSGQQAEVLAGLAPAIPWTNVEESAAVASARMFGAACSTQGRPLATSMSTAEVARDMDVMRRAVGDSRLTYLGWSYGTYLGQVYANLFPDRVRALVIDGVLDPIAWAGTPSTRSRPQTDRLRSADGAYRALIEILVRCNAAGPATCPFAAGDPVLRFARMAKRLQAAPLVVEDPDFGTYTITYSDFVATMLSALYGVTAGDDVAMLSQSLWDLMMTTSAATRVRAASDYRARAEALAARITRPTGWDFPYDNSFEAFASVLCTDGLNPDDAGDWPTYGARADNRAPYFGRIWNWSSVQCAMSTWTGRDEDAYRGPFTKRTVNPVLVVGNYWDPATNYAGAQKAAALLPNSRLLSSTNWGHTAYGTSACATGAIETYLLTTSLPPTGTLCQGDVQPFTGASGQRTGGKMRPPITPLIPALR